jgi:hypothetical protein
MKYPFLFIFIFILTGCSKETLDSSSTGGNQNGVGGSLARFTLSGNYLYVVEDANLKTFDVSNPANPILKNTQLIGNNIETIYPYRDNLFIGSQNGMFIYSITNPAFPQYAGSASHVRSCDPVVANDTAAFVTLRGGGFCGAASDGLYIYRITNLLSPVLVQTVDLSTPYGLGLKDSILFVCRGNNGLAVINIQNINSPVVLQTISGYDFRDVIPYNDLLICYVTNGIALYDISNLNNIRFIKKVLN